MYRLLAIQLLCVWIMASGWPQNALAQDRAIVFGDSLSDNGNLFAATGFPTDPPYFGNGSANGPLWAEQLFGPMNSPVQGTGVLGNVNMAYFGARTDGLPPNSPPPHIFGAVGVTDQITDFVAAAGPNAIAPSDTVFVWAGANNIRECIDASLCVSPVDIQNNAVAAANAQIGNIQTLIGLGARTLLVPNAQNLGATPYYDVVAAPPNAKDAALASSNAFNAALLPGLSQLAASAPAGTNIIYADVDALQKVILANPAAFGFTNVTVPCLAGPCLDPNSFYFYDIIHPTALVQGYFALYFSKLLNTAPAILDAAPLGESLHRSSELITNAVFDRLANWFSGTYVLKNGPYAELLGQLGRYSDGARGSDFNLDLGGVRIGWDQRFDTNLFGASLAVLTGNQDAQSLSSDVTVVRGDIYGTHNLGPVYGSLNLGFGGVWFDDVERRTGFGPVVANSDTEGYTASATAEIGMVQQLGGITLIPSARLSYIHAHLNNYQERAPILALDFNDQKSDALLGRISVRAVSRQDIVGLPTALFAEIGYEGYLAFSGNDITATLANNTALPTVVSPGDLNGPGFLGKLGLSSQISETMYLDVNYGVAIHEDDGETHSGRVRLKAHF